MVLCVSMNAGSVVETLDSYLMQTDYRSGMVNLNTVKSKFHLIRSFFEIFATFLLFHV